MSQRRIRSGAVASSAAAVAAVAATLALGAGVASASAFDDQGQGADQGQSDTSADSGYQAPSTTSSSPADGVISHLGSPENAGSGVTPNGFSPGQTLPGGSLGGL
jgi:hypothetical protein